MARLASPLYELTRKGAGWVWSNKCENAFDSLRHKLVQEPILLAFPDWKKKFVIEADASTTAVAAVLSQRNAGTGQLHPIDFFLPHLAALKEIIAQGS